MSGYKHSWASTQEDYQAGMAFAAFNSIEPGTDEFFEALDAMPEAEWAKWRAAAEVVRDDTRQEPRF